MSETVLIWLMIEQDGAFLLCRHKPEQHPFAGQWILPGARMEADESASETISRFAGRELDVKVRQEEFVDTFFLDEGGVTYAINVFRPGAIDGRLHYRESGPFADARWFRPGGAWDEALSPKALVELLEGKRHWQASEAAPNDTASTS